MTTAGLVDASFRADIDSLEIKVDDLPRCVVHARALRRWTGGRTDGAACLGFVRDQPAAVLAAIRLKAQRTAATAAFHLTSRDLAAALDRNPDRVRSDRT